MLSTASSPFARAPHTTSGGIPRPGVRCQPLSITCRGPDGSDDWSTAVAIAYLALVGTGCGGGGGDSDFSRATNTEVRDLVAGEVGDDSARRVDWFQRRTCRITYRPDDIVLDAERELLDSSRPIWRALFSDRQLRSAELTMVGTTVSVGGKESEGPLLSITCDRAAHRQIDWDLVDVHGVKQLCDWQPRVNLD